MERVYFDSWQGKTFGKPEFHRGRQRFLEQVAALGWLRSYVLYKGSEPVAFQHSYAYGGTLTNDDRAFSQSFAKQSPGSVLTYRVLEDLHADGRMMAWDFGFGELPYKRSLGNVEHDSAIVYFAARRRWRIILRLQQAIDAIYDGIRLTLVWLRADTFFRKLIKRQQ
jgi:hypothetical protein